jgi:predicted dehydrogenase
MAASASRVADATGTPVGAGEAAASGLDRLEPYRQELGAFCSAIKYRTPPPCTGEEALAAAIVILMANEAITRRQPIELDDKIYAV